MYLRLRFSQKEERRNKRQSRFSNIFIVLIIHLLKYEPFEFVCTCYEINKGYIVVKMVLIVCLKKPRYKNIFLVMHLLFYKKNNQLNKRLPGRLGTEYSYSCLNHSNNYCSQQMYHILNIIKKSEYMRKGNRKITYYFYKYMLKVTFINYTQNNNKRTK